ncbi:MAG: 5-deoxy-glucuronate isomerase [Actinomycetota bacterium]|nr:5-deoxy-glucuronate isomerase [Actinomycetota bacterium]
MDSYFASGRLSNGPDQVAVVPDGVDWKYTGLSVASADPGESRRWSSEGREAIVVPLSGALTVVVDGEVYDLAGRPSPWGVTDVLYLPLGSESQISAPESTPGGVASRYAIAWAVAERVFPVQYLAADAVSVELRGAGISSRQVNNFGTPGRMQADRLIACEVMQPGGNWSSYPPHKHDVAGEAESQLEEIYYFEVAPSPAGTPGFALQRVYSSEAGEIDVTVEIHSGDVVLIPFGYHGPSVAAPGHPLYYLNVMAGPADPTGRDRAWLISDDPQHAWIRESWKSEAIDPRLPFTASGPATNNTDKH